MSKQGRTYEHSEWAGQKIDEVEAALVLLENAVMTLNKDVHVKTGADTVDIKGVGKGSYVSFGAELAEVELACQNFVTTVRDYANVIKQMITTRAEACSGYWLSFLEPILMTASDVIEQAYGEIDAAIRRLAGQIEKAGARPVKVSGSSGDDSGDGVRDSYE